MAYLKRSAIIALTLIGSALPAFASMVDFNTLSPGLYSQSFSTSVTGSFQDYYTFTLTGPAEMAASITSSFLSPTQEISNFDLSLFTGTPSSPGSSLGSVMATTVGNQQSAKLGLSPPAGTYFLEVSGLTGSASYGGSLALQISAVPLPPALPLFAGSLLALAGFGYVVKRRGSTKQIDTITA